MAKKCKKCDFMNEDEAKFCAQCGEELRMSKFDKFFLGMIFLFTMLILFSTYEENQRDERREAQEKQVQVAEEAKSALSLIKHLKDITGSEIDELSNILEKNKDTFETTGEFQTRQDKAIAKILYVYSAGTATLENYDADTWHLTTKLSWHKGLKDLLDEEPPMQTSGYIPNIAAKTLFTQDKTNFYIVASVVDGQLHIEGILAYIISSDDPITVVNLNLNYKYVSKYTHPELILE